MARVRHHRNAGSESIPWATLQDAQVSYLARGLLGHCLSLPPDWDFSADRVAKEGKSEFKEGVVAIRRAFKELEAAGYRRLVTEQDDRGRFDTYADFAAVPVPEWIEEYHARAARAKRRKRPGPKALSPAAKAAAKSAAAKGRATRTNRAADQDESVFPQVAPEVRQPQFGEMNSGQPAKTDVFPGRTGSASTAVRSTQLQRSTPTERGNTHTQTAPSSADSGRLGTDGEGVCVEDKNQSPIDDELVEAGMTAARRGIAAGARNKLTGSQLRRAQTAVEQAVARGCTPRQITEAVREEHTDDRTTHPGSAVERALDGLEPSPEGMNEARGSHRDREADEAAAANLAAMAATEAPEREKATVVERKPGRDWRTLAAVPEKCKPEAAKSEPATPRQRVEENEEAERARQIALLTAEFGSLD